MAVPWVHWYHFCWNWRKVAFRHISSNRMILFTVNRVQSSSFSSCKYFWASTTTTTTTTSSGITAWWWWNSTWRTSPARSEREPPLYPLRKTLTHQGGTGGTAHHICTWSVLCVYSGLLFINVATYRTYSETHIYIVQVHCTCAALC